MKFLQDKGFDLGEGGNTQDFVQQPSPLGGKRWYLSVMIRGKPAEFLVDTGASHSMIGHGFFRSLAMTSDTPIGSSRVSTADGSSIRTYGRQVLPLGVNNRTYIISPTIAEITDDGILGLDFCALYGVEFNTKTGMIRVMYPEKTEVKCILRKISGVSTVVQTVKIAAQHVCNVLLQSREFSSSRMGVVEPDTGCLAKLGLASTHTLVQNARWSVVPVCNPNCYPVYLEKGTEFGKVTLADVNGRADSPEVERAAQKAAEEGKLEIAVAAVMQTGLRRIEAGSGTGACQYICYL